ncbi:MAG TPA: hypothetical protein PLV45_07035, partial [bacterium]|nr:hypothetical protein [bacterium]
MFRRIALDSHCLHCRCKAVAFSDNTGRRFANGGKNLPLDFPGQFHRGLILIHLGTAGPVS